MTISTSGFLRAAVIGFGVAILVGCAAERPQSTVSPGLNSGITSQNGGGQLQTNFGASQPIKISP